MFIIYFILFIVYIKWYKKIKFMINNYLNKIIRYICVVVNRVKIYFMKEWGLLYWYKEIFDMVFC